MEPEENRVSLSSLFPAPASTVKYRRIKKKNLQLNLGFGEVSGSNSIVCEESWNLRQDFSKTHRYESLNNSTVVYGMKRRFYHVLNILCSTGRWNTQRKRTVYCILQYIVLYLNSMLQVTSCSLYSVHGFGYASTLSHPSYQIITFFYMSQCILVSPLFPVFCHIVEQNESALGYRFEKIIVMCSFFDPPLTKSVWSTLLWPFHAWSQSLDTYWYRPTAVSQACWVVLSTHTATDFNKIK